MRGRGPHLLRQSPDAANTCRLPPSKQVSGLASARADSVAMQEDHDVADDLLLRPRALDALPAFRPDAVNIFQPGGLLLNDVKNRLAKLGHGPFGVRRADAFDPATAQLPPSPQQRPSPQ